MDPMNVTKFWSITNACTHAGGSGNACTDCMKLGLAAVLGVLDANLNLQVNEDNFYMAREISGKSKAYGDIQTDLQT